MTSRSERSEHSEDERPRVLLVSMPFGALERPSLGLSLLQPALRRAGVRCATRYLGFDFADFVGVDDYAWVQTTLPYTAFAGDWAFTASLYGERPEADAAYVAEILRATWRLDDDSVARLYRVRARCAPFLDHCLRAVAWDDYDVVGFTSTFEQNIASLALARRLKERHPRLVTVFGGANWEGEMGEELHRRFPFVDVVCSGEADLSFPAVVDALASPTRPLHAVPGIVFRDGDATVSTGPAAPVEDLDALPFADFDDWFAALAASAAGLSVAPVLLLETARGCWWGARSHCTFCGLNGGTMAFRSKSPERALAELRRVIEHHGVPHCNITDNILDMRYFRTFLPMVAKAGLGARLFFEVKSNLSHAQVRTLRDAGVAEIQPGIESLSDHVLDLMGKGTTALRNIQLLKWCREFGIKPDWNLLYGFPGEEQADYDDMLRLLDAIRFLDPPTAWGPIRLDRFSPYHADPASYGMVDVRPLRTYRHLYPFPVDSLRRIAYHFEFDYADGRAADAYARPLIEAIRQWMAEPDGGGLWQTEDGDGDGDVVLVDERGGRRLEHVLRGWQARAYALCDRVQPLGDLAASDALHGVGRDELASFLGWCVAQGLALVRNGHCLALAVHVPARDRAEPPARLVPLLASVGDARG